MHINVSSDEYTELVAFVLSALRGQGHAVTYFGPGPATPAGLAENDWPVVTLQAVAPVAAGSADRAVVMCWTGTGACLVANKVPGIRAALAHDAETARGARRWNDANVLALSLRATALPIAQEILAAWLSTPAETDEWNRRQMARLQAIEARFSRGEGYVGAE